MKFLFDTDHISILQRKSAPEFVALSVRIARESPADLAFSIVSFHEQVLGCHTYLSRARNPTEVSRGYGMLTGVLEDFGSAQVLPFDALAATTLNGLIAQGVRVASMDLRIACIALSRGLTVLTRNTRDFRRVPGLLTEDWTV